MHTDRLPSTSPRGTGSKLSAHKASTNGDVKGLMMAETPKELEDNILASSAVVEGEEGGQDGTYNNNAGLDLSNSLFGKKASVGSTSIQPLNELSNPVNMRGSLNVGYRRHQMHRIN